MIVPFYRHSLHGGYAEAIATVLDGPFLTGGGVGRQVEKQLANFFGVPFALLGNSWTNTALAVLLALDIGPGDEVIVPAQTFVATANVVELVGATPVFIDVDPVTMLMTPQAVQRALGTRIRAVIPVHLFGQMCDVRGIREVVGDSVAVIEDCAHSFEARRDGYMAGSHSDAAVFSFYATKNVTCGEGGAVITRREDLHVLIRQCMSNGISPSARERFAAQEYLHSDMVRLGGKSMLSEINAALLPPQIEAIWEQQKRREALAQRYQQALTGLPIHFIPDVTGSLHARHLFPIFMAPAYREAALKILREHGIGVTVNYRCVTSQTFYRRKYGGHANDFPVAEQWGLGTISLPLFPGLTEPEQDHVIAVLRERVAAILPA